MFLAVHMTINTLKFKFEVFVDSDVRRNLINMNRGGFLINDKSTYLLRTAILVSSTYKTQDWAPNSVENYVIRSITITYLQQLWQWSASKVFP